VCLRVPQGVGESMKIGKYDFEARSGVTGYCKPYNPAGVKAMAGGKVRLSLVRGADGDYCSAGVLGPALGDGTYMWQTTGRVDAMDPAAVFAIWLYDDATENEIDVVEWTRWGDLNQPGNMHIQAYFGRPGGRPTPVLPTVRFAPCRAFDLYRYRLIVAPTEFLVQIEGSWLENGWNVIQTATIPRLDMLRMGNVRIGLWLPPTGFRHTRAAARGPLSIDVFGFDFKPLQVPA